MSKPSKITRRSFFGVTLGAAAAAGALGVLSSTAGLDHISGSILGASADVGHLLRSGKIPAIDSSREVGTVIVGGGISGLSAAWALTRHGYSDFTLLELDSVLGGNACSGANKVSAYPWGAHYVPVPGRDATLVRTLFEELGVIDRYEDGKPHYNEEYLCAAPQERLHIYGSWQDGLMPQIGTEPEDHAEYQRFHEMMEEFKGAIGSDGRAAFSIPLELSSQDPAFLKLDLLSMSDFLLQNGFVSPFLRWYVNYCCRDDYGATLENVSAWAGVHYFASRRAWAANVDDYEVLTWPEGNGWIVAKLAAKLADYLQPASLVFSIQRQGAETLVDYFCPTTRRSQRIRCKGVIYCAPRFTAPYIVTELRAQKPGYIAQFEYDPWMVANITLSALPQDSAQGLAWDNVLYHSSSLGYINATHQAIGRRASDTVITYYLPLSQASPKEAREMALRKSWNEWRDLIVADLRNAHPDIISKIQNIDVWLWGHAMIRPSPGFIWGNSRAQAQAPLGDLFFAHSDMSGISIFEEAQYRGVSAAEALLTKRGYTFKSLV